MDAALDLPALRALALVAAAGDALTRAASRIDLQPRSLHGIHPHE